MSICISEKDVDGIGLKAFLALTAKNSRMIKELMVDDHLLNAVKEVFGRKEPNPLILNRIASLITAAVEQKVKNIDDFCIFLFDFLPYCKELMVSNLYFEILKNDQGYINLQKRMVINGIPNYIAGYLISNEISDDETIISLLKILTVGICNKVIGSSFFTDNLFAAIDLLVSKDISLYVKNALWNFISEITNEYTLTRIEIYLHVAISIISDLYTSVHEYYIYVIEFISKLIQLKSIAIEQYISEQFLQVFIRLMEQFNNSTNFLASIFRLINALINSEYAKIALLNLLPYISFVASSSEKNALNAFCNDFLITFNQKKLPSKLQKEIKNIDLYQEYLKFYQHNYSQKRKSPYGGSINTNCPYVYCY